MCVFLLIFGGFNHMFVCRAVWRWRSGKRVWSLRTVRSPTTVFRRSQLPPQVCPDNMCFYDNPKSKFIILVKVDSWMLLKSSWQSKTFLWVLLVNCRATNCVFWKQKVYKGLLFRCWRSAANFPVFLSSLRVKCHRKWYFCIQSEQIWWWIYSLVVFKL